MNTARNSSFWAIRAKGAIGTDGLLLPVVFTVIENVPGVAGVALTATDGALQVLCAGAPVHVIVALT